MHLRWSSIMWPSSSTRLETTLLQTPHFRTHCSPWLTRSFPKQLIPQVAQYSCLKNKIFQNENIYKTFYKLWIFVHSKSEPNPERNDAKSNSFELCEIIIGKKKKSWKCNDLVLFCCLPLWFHEKIKSICNWRKIV